MDAAFWPFATCRVPRHDARRKYSEADIDVALRLAYIWWRQSTTRFCRRHVRDDFPRQTVTDIAKGVAFRCSNPDCQCATTAANAAQDGIITLGVAAHICAASPGGPRYDPGQAQ